MANPRTYFTYILTNKNRRLYIGMTNDLNRRLEEPRTGTKGFASAYKMAKIEENSHFSDLEPHTHTLLRRN